MKNQLNLIENNNKSIEFEHCAFPEEIMHEKAFCFAADGTGDFTNKQPLTVSNGNLISANEGGGWRLNTYSDLMKSLEENPQVKTQIHNPAVGFLCTPDYVVLDIDGHGKEGLCDAKKDFVSRYAETTYCEKSLSGNGYHMIFRCDSPLTSGKINVDFGEGLNGVEVFGGLECKTHVILTGNSNKKPIGQLPDELREKIKEATKNRDSTKQKTFYSGICNESAILLAKIDKNPVDIYCELFEGKIEDSKSHKETRCVTNMFDKKFGLNAHHFGVKNNGEWCLYGNDMKGGSLLEAVAVVKGLYDFDEGKIKNQSDIPKIIEITKERFNIPEENTITIEGLQKIQKKASEARSIYKPYYDTIKDRLPSVIRTWVDAVSLLTGAYKEYSIVNLLTIGAILTCGRAKYLEYHGCTEKRVSFRTFILGQSSISNKTTAIKLAKQLLEKVERDWWGLKWGSAAELPDGNRVDIAPTFYADLDAIYTEARLLQDFADNNIRYLIDDESGSQLLSVMKREYNGTLRDVLCKICDGSDVHKTLKKTKKNDLETDFHIMSPSFNCIIASTPETFQSYARPDDATSGYLYRFLYCTPMYSKKKVLKQDIRKNRPQFNELEKSVIKELANILKYFEKSTMTYEFSEESEIFLDEWEEKSTKSLTRDQQLSLESRLQAYVFDIAVILHILAGNYDIKTVNDEYVTLAAEMIDGLFRPSGNFMIEGTNQDDLNKLGALVKKLTADGEPVSHSKLLKNSRMDKNKFALLIDTLCDSGQVLRGTDEKSDAHKKPALYIWSEYYN